MKEHMTKEHVYAVVTVSPKKLIMGTCDQCGKSFTSVQQASLAFRIN